MSWQNNVTAGRLRCATDCDHCIDHSRKDQNSRYLGAYAVGAVYSHDTRCFAISQLHRMLKIRCFAKSQLHRMLKIRCIAKSHPLRRMMRRETTRCTTTYVVLPYHNICAWEDTLFCQITALLRRTTYVVLPNHARDARFRCCGKTTYLQKICYIFDKKSFYDLILH